MGGSERTVERPGKRVMKCDEINRKEIEKERKRRNGKKEKRGDGDVGVV